METNGERRRVQQNVPNYQAIISIVLPLVAWMMGLVPHFSFLVALITAIVGIAFIWLTALLFFHAKLVLTNQTTHERNSGRLSMTLNDL